MTTPSLVFIHFTGTFVTTVWTRQVWKNCFSPHLSLRPGRCVLFASGWLGMAYIKLVISNNFLHMGWETAEKASRCVISACLPYGYCRLFCQRGTQEHWFWLALVGAAFELEAFRITPFEQDQNTLSIQRVFYHTFLYIPTSIVRLAITDSHTYTWLDCFWRAPVATLLTVSALNIRPFVTAWITMLAQRLFVNWMTIKTVQFINRDFFDIEDEEL